MLGSATVIADFTLPGDTSQVAARLLDVAPDGQETLVARGLWRPATGGPTRQVFQLHPNGWTFAEGHVPKLELLPKDSDPGLTGGYGRASDDQQPVDRVGPRAAAAGASRSPAAHTGLVKAPAPRVLPEGYELAADFAALPNPHPKLTSTKLKRKGSKLFAKLVCPAEFASCNDGKLTVTTKKPDRRRRSRSRSPSAASSGSAAAKTRKLGLKLTKKAKRYLSRTKPKLKVYVEIASAEIAEPTVEGRKGGRQAQATLSAGAQPNSDPVPTARPTASATSRTPPLAPRGTLRSPAASLRCPGGPPMPPGAGRRSRARAGPGARRRGARSRTRPAPSRSRSRRRTGSPAARSRRRRRARRR